ncbi:MAG: amylo-alpha-1,6-glucosidase [Chloroflexota bacterium]|nr:amylo-alpha-1,6-glucosidase [Chloroflexota bacterium]
MTVSLKEDSLVLVTEDDGSIPTGGTSPLGLYYHDTQYLSGFELRVNGERPLLLSANHEQNYVAAFQLMQASGVRLGTARHAQETLSIRRTRYLADGLRERIGILNATPKEVALEVELEFEATFKDMFAVRGYRGIEDALAGAPCRWDGDELVFERAGRDGVRRATAVALQPAPEERDGATVRYRRVLPAQGVLMIELAIVPTEDGSGERPSRPGFDEALDQLNARYRRFLRACTRFRTSSETLNEGLIQRSALDIRALLEFEDTGPFPTAGIPWYAVPFGRDALVCAYETLAWAPDIARGTLRLLAACQGTKVDEQTEEAPGKIFHELRRGELARLGAIPHRPFYGSVDATPLFALVVAETVRWTGDRELWRELRPAAERALEWCDGPYGDPDRDGYVEYGMRPSEMRNQGWKDSALSLSYADGEAADLPAALVEVQGYVYAAKMALAPLYELDGDRARGERLRAEARELARRFERDFWMDDEGCYAQALDARKEQVRAVTSNAGHALWSGIANADRAGMVVQRLMQPDMFSGWGIRTLSSRYSTYNPMSYHNGSVWPHDNALIAEGFARYGYREEATAVIEGLFEAGKRFPDSRLPELFCGFPRDLRFSSRPADYLVACIPQAWSAGVVFLCLRTLMGLEPRIDDGKLVVDPALPGWLPWITVDDMRVGDAKLSFRVARTRRGVIVQGGGQRLVRAERERERSERELANA